jgi:hypothetical protein
MHSQKNETNATVYGRASVLIGVSALGSDALRRRRTPVTESFRPIPNTIFRLALLGACGLLAFTLWISFQVVRSPYEMRQQV